MIRVLHDGTKTVKVFEVTLGAITATALQQFDCENADLAAELSTRNLAACHTIGQQLAAKFMEIPEAKRGTFLVLYAPITALVEAGKYRAAALALEQVNVTDPQLVPIKEAMLQTLRNAR